MIEVEVTTTPINLGAAVGAPMFGRIASYFRIQNRGPNSVYRARGVNAPDPARVRGFRHATGSLVYTPIPANDVENNVRGATWVWTTSGTATLVAEVGDY